MAENVNLTATDETSLFRTVPEAMLWLLLTGKVPTEAETRQLSKELAERGELPKHVEKLLDE